VGTEIERKFVLRAAPEWLDDAPSEPISQGYLAIGGETEVRVRLIAGQPKLTVKRGSGLERDETEIPLDGPQFRALWPLTDGRRVEKVRHRRTESGVAIEIDVYHGPHEGLIVAEVEFDSLAASDAFDPPEWLGEEVTGDERWANRNLALSQEVPGT
jgi:CYTH domain-containing protein